MNDAVETVAGLLVECEGGCGVWVRQDAEKLLCSACLGLDNLYEERLVRDRRIQIYAERDARGASCRTGSLRGEDARQRMGVVPCPERNPPEQDNGSFAECHDEASGLPAILSGDRRIVMAFVGLGLLVAAGSVGMLVWGLAKFVAGVLLAGS